MKLLIAEDETMCLDALRSLDWESVGIDKVICAKDGETAYRLALSEKADIILSDIQMPKISGLELAERLSVILLFFRKAALSFSPHITALIMRNPQYQSGFAHIFSSRFSTAK